MNWNKNSRNEDREPLLRQNILIGTGGHARVIVDALNSLDQKILGCLSKSLGVGDTFFGNVVLGDDSVLSGFSESEVDLVNGIGSLPGRASRWLLADKLRSAGYQFKTIVHPKSLVGSEVVLDNGVQIMARAVVQAGTSIGVDSIVNTGAIVDHDCKIGPGCHLAPGVVCSGEVTIGRGTHIGTGATIIQGIRIGENCVVAAGATVYKDILPDKVFKN